MKYTPVFSIIPGLAASYFLGYTPLLFAVIYVVFSILTFAAYAKDKRAAESNNWRIPENTLHFLSLLCGWPGAVIAQQKLRHKTKKVSFRVVFWITVLLNSGALVWLHTNEGNAQLHTAMTLAERFVLAESSPGDVRDVLLTLLRFQPYI